MSLIDEITSYSPLFTELLAKRGLHQPEQIEKFLEIDVRHFENPLRMKGMKEGVERLEKAIRNQEKILIHGDYDVDGVTGSALLARTLAHLKAGFRTFLPERARDGYGVSEDAIRSAAQDGFSLLITVDCGITAHQEIGLARQLGLDVIVIDHHRIPPTGLPPASVIINPQQEDCAYPFKGLSAAGLVFKLSQALIGSKALQFLDLAALSTICDVAPLLDENRIIVKKGLEILSKRSNPGLTALSEVSGIKSSQFNVGHLGFILGPRINASGRMSTPEISLRLLMTENAKEAGSLAQVLNEENKLRQKEERQVVKEAVFEVERTTHFNRHRVLVVGRDGWHQGVVGIVASRLVDKFHRPALVVAIENGIGKGSGRSIKGFNLFAALESCKPLLEEFGGHEQAVGFSLKQENLPKVREKINEFAFAQYAAEAFIKKIPVDLEIKLEDLRSAFLHELSLLEPHGVGNPRPVFLTKNLRVKNIPKAQNASSLQFWVTDESLTCEAVWGERYGANLSALKENSRIDLAYSVKKRQWNGLESLILEVKEATTLQL